MPKEDPNLARKLPFQPLPKVATLPLPEGWRLVGWGWDTIQEAWDVKPSGKALDAIAKAQAKAKADENAGGEGRASLTIGGRDAVVHSSGQKGGFKYRVETDSVILAIKDGGPGWGVSVRYKSVGLWLDGWDSLHQWVNETLRAMFYNVGDAFVSRADYCFDFHAPGFAEGFCASEWRERIVCHSSTKARLWCEIVGTSKHDETLTIGRTNNLQSTIYNKAKEITDLSGKEWFYDLWAQQADGEILDKDVWRLEVRMGKEYLKARNVRTKDAVEEFRPELLADALTRQRVAVPTADSNRDRWPMCPFWSEALRHTGAALRLPLGRYVSGQREALADLLEAQLAGVARTADALMMGEGDEDGLRMIFGQACDRALSDPEAKAKLAQAKKRYQFVKGIKDDDRS